MTSIPATHCVPLVRRLQVSGIVLAVAILLGQSLLAEELSHQVLMQYRDGEGTVQPVQSLADWQQRRRQILDGLQSALGALPERTSQPVEFKQIAEQRGDGFYRRTLHMTSPDGEQIPADLYVPDPAPSKKVPGILALHPTGKEGKRIVAGEGPRLNRQYAVELAQRGYVVIAPDYPSFGDYPYDFSKDSYDSGTMKGIANHMICVDLLTQSVPEVDPEHIGVIGHSLGGHNAMFLGVFDERVDAVVSSCGWTPFHDYYGGNISGWTSDRYMPLLRDRYALKPDRVPFDFYEVVGALAPRAFFSSSPLEDANFAVAGVKKAIPQAREVYDLYGAADRLQVVYPHCDHDFPTEIREQSYRFLDEQLHHQPRRQLDFSSELPRMQPLEPQVALQSFSVAAGFEIQQTASEPLVTDPVAMAFDEQGRLYVVEMRDYSEQDTEQLGRIRVLEDRDGDGTFDESHIFADQLSWPTAVIYANGGVYVGAAPHIYFLKDEDGDLQADQKQIVFTGFGRSNVQGLLNSFRWGVDNRIHGATSSSGGTITSPLHRDIAPVNLRGRDFSFDPQRLDLRAETGGAQHGLSFDPVGRKFVCSNSDHAQQVVYDDRYLVDQPDLDVLPPRISIADDGGQAPVFRRSPVEPWRIVRTRLRVSGEVRGPVEGGGRPAGYFTGATGITIYSGNAWPDWQNPVAIIGDVGSNIVHRKTLHPQGVRFVASRIDQESELVSSSDTWFRPVQFANAPDGCLHILDMYREVIEHPKSLPPSIKQHLDLTSGRERGRLYRLAPEKFQGTCRCDLGAESTVSLVQLLTHSNGWHRETASRLLCERADSAAIPALKSVITQREREPHVASGVIRALYVLKSLHALTMDDISTALDHQAPMVRVHALQLLESLPAVANFQSELVIGEDAEVDLQLAFSCRYFSTEQRRKILKECLVAHADDEWIAMAALTSSSQDAAVLLSALLSDARFIAAPNATHIARQLASLIPEGLASSQLEQLLNSLDQSRQKAPSLCDAVMIALRKRNPHPELQERISQAAARNVEVAHDATQPVSTRLQALSLLAMIPDMFDYTELMELLSQTHPPSLQSAAFAAMQGTAARDEFGRELLGRWALLSPALKREAESLLLSRPQWLELLLKSVQSQTIAPQDLSLTTINQLKNHRNADVRQQAEALFQHNAESIETLLVRYQSTLTGGGNVTAGRAHFRKQCAVCHRLENVGTELGPNLISMQNRGVEAFLTNILAPNRELNPEFQVYQIATSDGQTFSGLIRSETPTSITLTQAENKQQIIRRSDIDQIRATGKSLMPEGLEKLLPPTAMADLLAYLMSVK